MSRHPTPEPAESLDRIDDRLEAIITGLSVLDETIVVESRKQAWDKFAEAALRPLIEQAMGNPRQPIKTGAEVTLICKTAWAIANEMLKMRDEHFENEE